MFKIDYSTALCRLEKTNDEIEYVFICLLANENSAFTPESAMKDPNTQQRY